MKTILMLLCLFSCSCLAQPGKKYLIVFLNKKPDAEKIPKEETEKIMEGHMANMDKLAKEGKLLAAGPFEGGGGIFIFNTTSLEEANVWLRDDPGVKANRWNIEILPYIPRIGSVCPVKEPYEMTHYQFIRYDAVISKYTANDHPQIFAKHDEYLRELANTGNVVTEAVFGPADGGILIIKGTLENNVIEADPGVQEGLLELQIKKLYIAKGSFCEN